MRRVFACGVGAVVAARTVIADIHVIKIRWYPAGRRVTIVAGTGSVQVRWVFAGCGDAIMTGAAGAKNLGMVNGKRGREHVGVVAVFADIAGLNMRQALAGRLRAIVAVDAVAGDVHMVEIRWQPANGRVTVVAVYSAGDVSSVFAGCGDAVMA